MSTSIACQKYQCKCKCFVVIENPTKWSKDLCRICNHSILHHSNEPLPVFNNNNNNNNNNDNNNLNGYHHSTYNNHNHNNNNNNNNNNSKKNLVGLNKKTKHKRTSSNPVSNGVYSNNNNNAKALKFSNGKRRPITLSTNQARDIIIECKEDRDDWLQTQSEIDSVLVNEMIAITKEFDEMHKKLAQKQSQLIGKQVNNWQKWKRLLLDNNNNQKNNTMFKPMLLEKQSLVATDLNRKLDHFLTK